MHHLNFSGILKEIIERYPNIDISEFLQDELQLPLDKAEELAKRIEKKYFQKTVAQEQNLVRTILEKADKSESSPKAGVYSIDSLSEKEFEHFIKWLLKELGYEIKPGKYLAAFGVDLVATKDGEEIVVLARRYHKTCKVSNPMVLIAQEAKSGYGCGKSIVLATTYFTEQAIADAEKLNVELWDLDDLSKKIAEVRDKPDVEVQAHFPEYKGSLLQSLLRLGESKAFIVEPRVGGKYDLHVPGVKFPLLTFQAHSEADAVARCVYRIKYNEPVSEADGEALIRSDRNNNRVGPDDVQAYGLIIQYLEQFLE